MKFIHIADLHIGKKLKEMNLEEDQRFILKQIAAIARDENADAVLIAGDVYDSGSPNGESSLLLDEFLTELLGSGIEIFMISGNHDSPREAELRQQDIRPCRTAHMQHLRREAG